MSAKKSKAKKVKRKVSSTAFKMRRFGVWLSRIKLPSTVLSIILVAICIFLLGGGMYNILEKPITLMPRGRRIVFYYPYTLYDQFIVGSLIVMILYTMGFAGLVLAYESTKYANKPRQAFMLLIVGVLLILSAYLGCQHLITLKIRGGT